MIEYQHTLWINEDKRRYYRIRVQTDLFGCSAVIRTWGSLQSDRSGMQINPIEKDKTEKLLKSIARRRKKNGYHVVNL